MLKPSQVADAVWSKFTSRVSSARIRILCFRWSRVTQDTTIDITALGQKGAHQHTAGPPPLTYLGRQDRAQHNEDRQVNVTTEHQHAQEREAKNGQQPLRVSSTLVWTRVRRD